MAKMNNWVKLSIYSGALISLILPFYDLECHCFFPKNTPEKGTSTEGIQFIRTLVKGQQAYFVENGEFTFNLEELQLGIKPETDHYSYQILEPMVPVQSVSYPLPEPPGDRIFMIAQSKQPQYQPSYFGAVFLIIDPDSLEKRPVGLICQSEMGDSSRSELPQRFGDKISCPPGSKTLD